MKRRNFLALFGVSWLVNALPVAIAMTFQARSSRSVKSQPRSTKWHQIGTAEELEQAGQLLREESTVGPILIVAPSKTRLIAIDPTCPHMGCFVEWEAKAENFVCPCHRSKFALDGSLMEGPAIEPLQNYAVKIESNTVLVQSK